MPFSIFLILQLFNSTIPFKMDMSVMPIFPLNSQDAHVSNSNTDLTFPPSPRFLFQKIYLPLAFLASAWQGDIQFRDLLAIISRSFQSGDSLFRTTIISGNLQKFPQFVLLCIFMLFQLPHLPHLSDIASTSCSPL